MLKELSEMGICVIARKDESIESLIRRFKRKVSKSEILKEYREHEEFVKPSIAKRRKSLNARIRNEKEKLKNEKELEKRRKKFKREGLDEDASRH